MKSLKMMDLKISWLRNKLLLMEVMVVDLEMLSKPDKKSHAMNLLKSLNQSQSLKKQHLLYRTNLPRLIAHLQALKLSLRSKRCSVTMTIKTVPVLVLLQVPVKLPPLDKQQLNPMPS